ncbi:hypothetical protein DLF27_05290 [Salmonella enterica subsp. enterica serovar Cubana]|uniref:DUF1311 domain-containing protein n=1 Tax=Salmonella enterica subsp. enterica serovar Cubana TaxID=189201 RepID=A0A5I1N7G7_SALET|nr:DUF1311 domain-containing protein [Salmonella enterica]EBU8245189.1 hypothetical protein [Salmonella enterica subsp. enterica serovar Cubana]EDT3068488.1 DUF1311 domain-containing protein [Salmonella enterica subsp. enterica serovar Mbandaka]EBW2354123.1 DUF1311 domain-containing protein [Salmonella enterica subsp. enterica serovar Cubana]EBX2833957.1 hypothetical protein [Salmonella enterica subsp. enterica serovar Cubana]
MKNIISKKTFLFLSLMACSTASYAASFDCSKANASYEKIICSDNVLNRMDEALSNNYLAVMNSNRSQKVKDLLKKDQIAWLNKRNACSEYSCIRSLYEWRVDEICERYGSSSEKLSCISTQDISRQINKERETSRQEVNSNRRPKNEVIQELENKYSSEISRLGFSKTQLASPIYVYFASNYSRYSTLQEYLSLMLDMPSIKSMSKIDNGGYFGFRIKVTGKPSTGFLFHEEDGELYLNGLVAGDDFIEVVTTDQANQLTSTFYYYAALVLDKNNAKL